MRATAQQKLPSAPNDSSIGQTPSPQLAQSAINGSPAAQPRRTVAQRSLELRIWHHFLTVTSLTLPPPNRRDIQSLWTEDVPQWAFEYDFLLDALLGLTAIHMYILKTPDPSLLSCAYNYYAEAASKYRKALADINNETAGPILATSLFIGFQSKIVPRLHAANEPYKLPIGLFYLQRGVPTTYKAVAPFLQGHRMMAILFATMPPVEEVPACDDDQFLPEEVYQDGLAILRQLDAAEAMTPAAKETCKNTFAYVLAIHRSLEKDEPDMFTRRRVTAFFQLVPWPFVELLEQLNPIAMLILARYFAVSKVRDDLWWVRGLAEREVLGITGILPSEWRTFMDFPLKLMNGIASPPGSINFGPMSRASTASLSPSMDNASPFVRQSKILLIMSKCGSDWLTDSTFGSAMGQPNEVPPGINANYEVSGI